MTVAGGTSWLQVLPGRVDVVSMIRVALSVMLVSGGLAVLARAIAVPHGMMAGPLLIALGFGSVAGGLLLVARRLGARSLRRGRHRHRLWAKSAAWDDAGELDRMTGFDGAWERSAQASESSASLSRARIREASRSMLFAFESDARDASRSRRAIRSACRRSHARAALASRPKRHRVRARARVFM